MPGASLESTQKAWAQGKFAPVYLFAGEDAGAKHSALEALKAALKADDFNFSEFSGDQESQIDDILSSCRTAPMFSPRRLVLVRNVKLGQEGRKLLAGYPGAPADSAVLVVLYPDALPASKAAIDKDPVLRAFTAHAEVLVFGPLTREEAARRIRAAAKAGGFELSEEALEAVLDEAGTQWGIIQGELDKVRLFLKGRKTASAEDILACLGYRREAGPYELGNALERRDLKASLDVLRRMLEEGSDAYDLLPKISYAVLAQLKAKRMLKAGVSEFEMWGKVRIFGRDRQGPFLQAVKGLSDARLVADLRACVRVEADLKSKVWLDPAVELEGLVVGLCSK
ncbi:MAG TPA: DNA polymerase III subunit delta [Elusimicrobia bacterium]|nr:DNA polymerase III subunit delta [Elusimicrobiota bacterium]